MSKMAEASRKIKMRLKGENVENRDDEYGKK